MTPQIAPRINTAGQRDATPHITPHLTEEQFGELLSQSRSDAGATNPLVQAHLLACEQCAAELAGLRDSLSLFCQATTAYSGNQLRRLPQWSVPIRSFPLQPAYLMAAAALCLAALLPMQMLRQRSLAPEPVATSPASAPSATPAATAESDQALLEDINREMSASVPAPMQALADPTANLTASVQNPDQRKD